MGYERFRATLLAREKNRHILVDSLDSHCASERRKYLVYRIFSLLVLGMVGFWWIDRVPSLRLINQPVKNIQALWQSGQLLQIVQQEVAKGQMIGGEIKILPGNSRYRLATKPRELEQKSPTPAALYSSLPSAGQQQKLVRPARYLASMPSYRAPKGRDEARLPQVNRFIPIPQSRYIWVGRAVPLRLIPDSAQFPDVNSSN